jgi:hypothetical protein
VGNIKHASVGSHCLVFLLNAAELHRHFPTGKLSHAGFLGEAKGMEGSLKQSHGSSVNNSHECSEKCLASLKPWAMKYWHSS